MDSKSPTPDQRLKIINVGSRKSQLALIQTNLVIDKLKLFYSNNPDKLYNLDLKCTESEIGEESKDVELQFNVIAMTTTGDKVLDKALPTIGTKSLFTRELEIALLEGKVDFVVHSLKDLPTTLPEGCAIGAIMKRDNPNDAIVLKKSLRSITQPLDLLLGRGKIGANNEKYKIGTSSQRRIAMIKRCNPNLECIDIRGNLNTRFTKLDRDDSEYAAIILARAGLDRMGWSDRSSNLLTPVEDEGLSDWCYAVGQGAIAVECRSNDNRILDLLKPIVDIQTMYEAIAERSLMKKLEGGCSVPLGVRSTWADEESRRILQLEAIVLSLDGKNTVKSSGETAVTESQQHKLETTSKGNLETDITLTTGITLSRSAITYVEANMIECSKLGVEVANKMIELGCLGLMNC